MPDQRSGTALPSRERLREMLNVMGAPVGVDAEAWHDEARQLIDALYEDGWDDGYEYATEYLRNGGTFR